MEPEADKEDLYDAKCCGESAPWEPYVPPLVVNVTCADESTQAVIFPYGMEKFALKYEASLVSVEEDLVMYLHAPTGQWMTLGEEADGLAKTVKKGGTITSIRKDPDTPRQ